MAINILDVFILISVRIIVEGSRCHGIIIVIPRIIPVSATSIIIVGFGEFHGFIAIPLIVGRDDEFGSYHSGYARNNFPWRIEVIILTTGIAIVS